MKKRLIAGAGVAALAFAALPILGAFAAESITDTVRITIDDSCTVGSTTSTTGGGKTFSATVENGKLQTWDASASAGGTIKVTCNSSTGWTVTAIGASDGTSKTSMKPAGSGTAIATGTATSGATSNWMFKVAGTGAVTDYTSWKAIPGTATKVAEGSGAVSEGTIYTGYQIWVSATQEADTYEGKVTYTVAKKP